MLESSKKEFDECQEKVKKEIKLFEIQKSKDLRNSIKDYVHLSIRYEKIKLQNLEKTLNDMQQPVTKTPFSYQQLQLDETDSEESSPASSLKKKKKRQKHALHEDFNKKPLQSSASLPTRHTPKDKKKNASFDVKKTEDDTKKKDDKQKLMSASYDDRFSSTWLTEQ